MAKERKKKRVYGTIPNQRLLQSCPDCGCAVRNAEKHDEWHDRVEDERWRR